MSVTAFADPSTQVNSASDDLLEVAFQPTGSNALAWVKVPIVGTVKVTPAGTIATMDAYAQGDPDGAWQYVAKTGMAWTANFETAGTEKNATVNGLIQASLKTGTGAHILIRVTRASGAVYSGELVLSEPDPQSGARTIAMTQFKGTGQGKLIYDAPA